MDTNCAPILVGGIAGLVSGLPTTYVGYRLARRRDVGSERRRARREAASDLAAALRDLRTLVVRLGLIELPQPEVAQSFLAWVEAFARQKHAIPGDWPHLGSSVRAAVGTIFGAVTLADVRPDLEEAPLADPDLKWQERVQSYLDHLIDRISRWGNSERVAPPMMFDPWLAKTERRVRL